MQSLLDSLRKDFDIARAELHRSVAEYNRATKDMDTTYASFLKIRNAVEILEEFMNKAKES